MHLDARLRLVEEGPVGETPGVDFGVQLLAQAIQQVQVERCRHACRIVVGGFEGRPVLDQVDTYQQPAADGQQRVQAAQEIFGGLRVEVADARAREETDRPFAVQPLRQVHVAGEVGTGGVHLEPWVVGSQTARAFEQEVPGDIDAEIARRSHGFQKQPNLAACPAAEFDQRRVIPGDACDVLGGVSQDRLLGSCRIILRLCADPVEQLGAPLIVEELWRGELLVGAESRQDLVAKRRLGRGRMHVMESYGQGHDQLSLETHD